MTPTEENQTLRQVMQYLREGDVMNARKTIHPVLEHYDLAFRKDRTPLPDVVEKAYQAIELVQAGGKLPED
jgi:hypothetical protein